VRLRHVVYTEIQMGARGDIDRETMAMDRETMEALQSLDRDEKHME
jgi:hypothetical protein